MADINVKESAPKWKFPYKLKIENRVDNPPRWLSPVLSLAAVVIALLIGALVIWIAGADPWAAYTHIAKYSLGSWGVLSDTMVKAIPLMLVGLACSIAFRMKLWNIGAEGQFFLGAFGASMVVSAAGAADGSTQMAVHLNDSGIWYDLWCLMGIYSRVS